MRKSVLTTFCFLSFFFLNFIAFAQEDLLNMLDSVPQEENKTFVTSTFKSTRVINGHSVENIAAKHLDFRISHRFGNLNQGAYDMFGLDQATMRLGFEYGLTDRFMAGIGRSTVFKTYDAFAKYKLLRQTRGGKSNVPVSISYFGSIAVNTLKPSDPALRTLFSSRLVYVNQLLIARKFGDVFSFQLSPTFIHRNIVPAPADENDILSLGIGTRTKLSRSMTLNMEYFYLLPGRTADLNANSASIGLDIETGGHVFQLHFTNSQGLIERSFITETPNALVFKNPAGKLTSNIHFGFNISRTFSFDHSSSKKKW